MLMQLVLRKFLLLENVGSILSTSCRDCMDYIMEVWSPTPLKISVLASPVNTRRLPANVASEFPGVRSLAMMLERQLGTWVLSCHQNFTQWSCKKNPCHVDLDFSPACILPAGGSGLQLFWGLILNERLLTSCWKNAATGSSGLFRPEPEAPARRVFEIMAAKDVDEITKETATPWMAHESPLWRL